MTEQEYNKAMKRIEQIFDTDDLQEIYELDNLCNLVTEYEEKHFPLHEPTKEDIEEFRKAQLN